MLRVRMMMMINYFKELCTLRSKKIDYFFLLVLGFSWDGWIAHVYMQLHIRFGFFDTNRRGWD